MRIFLLLMSSPSSNSSAHRYFPEFLPLRVPQTFPSIDRRPVETAQASSNRSKSLNPLAAFRRNHVIFRECAWLSLLPQFHPLPPPRRKVPKLPMSPSWAAEHPAWNSSNLGAHRAPNKNVPRGLYLRATRYANPARSAPE